MLKMSPAFEHMPEPFLQLFALKLAQHFMMPDEVIFRQDVPLPVFCALPVEFSNNGLSWHGNESDTFGAGRYLRLDFMLCVDASCAPVHHRPAVVICMCVCPLIGCCLFQCPRACLGSVLRPLRLCGDSEGIM